MLFANSSSYTELVCIASLLQRKANWQEKKGFFLASFPHLHSRRQSGFKPSNYPQFITVMTIVKDKAKNSFWTGLTGKEGGFCQKDCTESCESPMGVQRVHMSLLLLSKGIAFLPSELEQSLHCIPVGCLHPPRAALWELPSLLATGLAPCHHHCDRVADSSQLLFLPATVLLCPAEHGLLPPTAEAG